MEKQTARRAVCPERIRQVRAYQRLPADSQHFAFGWDGSCRPERWKRWREGEEIWKEGSRMCVCMLVRFILLQQPERAGGRTDKRSIKPTWTLSHVTSFCLAASLRFCLPASCTHPNMHIHTCSTTQDSPCLPNVPTLDSARYSSDLLSFSMETEQAQLGGGRAQNGALKTPNTFFDN